LWDDPLAPLGFFVLADGLAKLFFPTRNRLSPKSSVVPIHRLPLKLAAFFDLRFEKLLRIERHGLPLIKRDRFTPDETASQCSLAF
jgi:hypothetical protein